METSVLLNNKLIAEFMGAISETDPSTLKPYNDRVKLNGLTYLVESNGWSEQYLKYHLSLDWLMPVVETISLEYTTTIHTFPGQNATLLIRDGNYKIGYGEAPNIKDAIYLGVMDFLEWHNNQ